MPRGIHNGKGRGNPPLRPLTPNEAAAYAYAIRALGCYPEAVFKRWMGISGVCARKYRRCFKPGWHDRIDDIVKTLIALEALADEVLRDYNFRQIGVFRSERKLYRALGNLRR